MIRKINILSQDKQVLFFNELLKGIGFSSYHIYKKTEVDEITAIAYLETGIISYQFLIKLVLNTPIITEEVLTKLRSEANEQTNKGLIFTTSSFSREAKKAKRKKGEIPIDLVDGDQLINRIKDLSIIF